jgi:nucleoid-associated protein YgaU
LAALGCAIWLTGSTLIYVIARASRVPLLIRSVEWMTLPAIRRVTERALGLVLVAATMTATPVLAAPPPPFITVVDRDGSLLPPGLAGPLPVGIDRSASSAGSAGPPLLTNSQDPPTDLVGASMEAVHVRSGDNLWVICRRHLTGGLGRLPANEEIAPYWRQVIARNQSSLISGNADLIYPGEVIELPPAG